MLAEVGGFGELKNALASPNYMMLLADQALICLS